MKHPPKDGGITPFVLCFAQKSFHSVPNQILLVRKPPQSLHEGMLNLPGGWVLENYSHKEMALRELRLETGLEGNNPEQMGLVFGPDYRMEVWRMTVDTDKELVPEPDQPALWLPWLELKERDDVLPQLLVIAPLLMAGLKGWTLHDQEHKLEERRYRGTLSWTKG